MARENRHIWTKPVVTLLLAFGFAGVLPPAVSFAATAATVDQGPTDVELPPILAPMSVQTRLLGYAYITVALAPNGRDKVSTIREKMPFLQDAFLREVNKASIVKADNTKEVDAAAIKTRLTERMNQILPPGTVSELKLEQIVLAPFSS